MPASYPPKYGLGEGEECVHSSPCAQPICEITQDVCQLVLPAGQRFFEYGASVCLWSFPVVTSQLSLSAVKSQ